MPLKRAEIELLGVDLREVASYLSLLPFIKDSASYGDLH